MKSTIFVIIAGLVIVSAIFTGCKNGELYADSGDSDKPIELLNETLFANHEGNELSFEFEILNKTNRNQKVSLEFNIKSIYDDKYVYGKHKQDLTVKEGQYLYTISFDTEMKDFNFDQKSDYTMYNIEYKLKSETSSYSSLKSLYNAMIKYNLQVVASDTWETDSRVPVRIRLTKAFTDIGIQNKAILVTLYNPADDNKMIFMKKYDTNRDGEVIAYMISPDEVGSYNLKVETIGRETETKEVASFSVQVNRSKKIYITTDKPLYQPGQQIHIRTMSLGTGKKPIANEPITINVLDGKGNKVFRDEKTTNDFGIASTVFQLASFVNLGNYKIEVNLSDTKAEKTVSVERYVLPKFKVSLVTDKDFYAPGETIEGTVSGNYFFGKPVSNSKVEISLYTFDVEWTLHATLEGETDSNGDYSFQMEVPDYLVGSQFEQGDAFVRLVISLTDNAEHTQDIDKTIPVAKSPIVTVVFPETERFGTGMDIKFYVVTADPLGKSIPCENIIRVAGKQYTVTTNEYGIGSFIHPVNNLPLQMNVESISKEHKSLNNFSFSGGASYMSEHILLRTDKPTYKVGDYINLKIFSSFITKKVYVDVVKEGKTLLTHSLELEDKEAEYGVPVSSDMDGIVRIAAYTILSDSTIVRDTRLVYVDSADDIQVSITPAKDEYKPGEEASLNITVTDNKGRGKPSAVGFVIVDEAVYALQDNKPGLERVYFEVEEAFKEPKYEIHTFSYSNIFVNTEEVDPYKAEVFLAATNNAMDWGIEYSSAYEDQDEIKETLNYYVYTKLYDATQKLYKLIYDNRGRLRNTKKSLKEQLQDIIDKEQVIVYDPWKKEIVFRINNDDTFSIICAGIDREYGTSDDYVFTYQINQNGIQSALWEFESIYYREDRVLMDDMEEEWDANNFEGTTVKTSTETSGEVERSESGQGGGGEDIRVRKYFPETLFVEPALITDSRGRGEVSLKVADSITSWRISSTANTKDGELGSNVSNLKVFQDFFVDIDFPVSLTQNDEVSVPIAIYNYLPGSQTIELSVVKRDWFEVMGESVKRRKLNANEVTVEYFRVKVKDIGNHAFQVRAKGSTMSDAIERRIEIKPDGDPIEISYSDRLSENVSQVFTVPPDAIDKSYKIIAKVYPGLFSQVVEGLDSLFRMPSGCFEQTSSTTYPNILTLKYMQDSGIISPEIELKASSYINQGYQRLLTFEVPGGGFEWFGSPPAHNILTAYGLMEFYDMSKVHPVDPAVITRTQNYLVSRQDGDGSFPPDNGGIPEGAINAFQNNKLRNTGYIAWSLAYSDYTAEPVRRAFNYIKDNLNMEADSYTLGILANALLSVDNRDKDGIAILNELDKRKLEEGNGYYWEQKMKTSYGSMDNVANIETSALIALAMLTSGTHFQTVEGVINYLITKKDSFGNWQSTQATIATLRVFVKSLEATSSISKGQITITVNDKLAKRFYITEKNYDVLQQFDISPLIHRGDNRVVMEMDADDGASFLYQISGVYYIPKEDKPVSDFEPVSINVAYDKTTLKVDDMVTVDVAVQNNYPDIDLGMMIVDIGIAPGFDVVMDDFNSYLEEGMFSKVEPAGRQLILYIDQLLAQERLEFQYRMKARYPMKVTSPASTVYSYYGDESDTSNPPNLEVED